MGHENSRKMFRAGRRGRAPPIDILFETLEPRLLLSGDVLLGLVGQDAAARSGDAELHSTLLSDSPQISWAEASQNAFATHGQGIASAPSATATGTFHVALAGEATTTGSYEYSLNDGDKAATTIHKAVAYVDAALPDYASLVDALRTASTKSASLSLDVVLINPGADGLKQIGADLAGRKDLSAVYIFSHGSEADLVARLHRD